MVPEACGARARGCGKRAEGCGRLAKEGLEGVEGGGKKTQGERSERKGSGRVRKGGGSGRAGGEMDAEGRFQTQGEKQLGWIQQHGRLRRGHGNCLRLHCVLCTALCAVEFGIYPGCDPPWLLP